MRIIFTLERLFPQGQACSQSFLPVLGDFGTASFRWLYSTILLPITRWLKSQSLDPKVITTTIGRKFCEGYIHTGKPVSTSLGMLTKLPPSF